MSKQIDTFAFIERLWSKPCAKWTRAETLRAHQLVTAERPGLVMKRGWLVPLQMKMGAPVQLGRPQKITRAFAEEMMRTGAELRSDYAGR